VTTSVLDCMYAALRKACAASSPDQEPPVALLWPDRERQFETVIPRLREQLPILTLGPHKPDASSGPAIWILCALAGTIPSKMSSESEGTPIVYLPGFSREEIRNIGGAPSELEPLADLQFRGTLWVQRGNRDWTATALLENESIGLGVRLSRAQAAREALLRALPQLLDEPVDALKMRGELGAAFFDGLINPDEVAAILAWLNDPSGWKAACDPNTWASFVSTCRDTYGLDPDTEGPLTAAEQLGNRIGAWKKVWDRFVDAPERYPNIPNLLRQAEPATLLDEHPDSWPGFNDRAEESVREALLKLEGLPANEVVHKVRELDANHGPRRTSVWARLGQAPLAHALEQLADLADRVGRPVGGTVREIAEHYAQEGWKTDNAAMTALAMVDTAADHTAVATAVDVTYRGWLDQGARALQKALDASPSPGHAASDFPQGSCVLFVDGLRLDVAQAVWTSLSKVAEAQLEWTFAAIPTVTPTAKPAVSPIADLLVSGPGLSPSARPDGPAFTREGLRKLLQENGWQDLAFGEVGDPSGRAWVEGGDIDTQGHNLASKFPRRLEMEVKRIVEQVMSLLDWGWKRVVVVTDHGWLYLPGGLPKVELPIHAADVRKGRCARLKENATVAHQVLAWHWDPKVRIAVAPGIGCYEAGKVYEHGGISPQESITPRLTVEARKPSVPASVVRISSVRWVGLRCRVEVTGAPEGALVDLRTLPADATTSIATEPRTIEVETAALVVADDTLEGKQAVIVVISDEGVLAQRPSIVGGEER
jgi:hypothetical protein